MAPKNILNHQIFPELRASPGYVHVQGGGGYLEADDR